MTSIGMTALRVSTDNGHKDITKLLIEYGASDRLYSNPSRKRPLSMRDIPIISPRIVVDSPDKLDARLDRMENILQTLLQLQGTHHVLNKSRKIDLKPTLGDCLRILLPIAHDWKTIGTLLEVEHHSLETIKRDNIGISKDCLRVLLHQWLDRVFPPPTWEELAEAVEHTDQTIAHKIRKIS